MKLLSVVLLLASSVLSQQQEQTTTAESDGNADLPENTDVPVSNATNVESISTFTETTNATVPIDDVVITNGDFDNVNDNVNTTNENVNTINENVNTTNENVNTTNEDVNTTNEDVNTINENVNTTNEDINTTNENVNTTNENVNTTNEDVNTTNEDVNTTNDNVNITNEDVNTTNENVNITNENVNTTNDNVNTIINNVNTTIENVNTTNEDVNTTNENVNTTNEDVNTTNENVNTTNEDVNTTNENFYTTNEDVNTTEENFNTTNEDVNTTNDNVNITNENVTTTNDNVNTTASEDVTTSTTEASFVSDNTSFDDAYTRAPDTTPIHALDNNATTSTTESLPTQKENFIPYGVTKDCLNKYNICTEPFRNNPAYCPAFENGLSCIKNYSESSSYCTEAELNRIEQLDCGPFYLFNTINVTSGEISDDCLARITQCLSISKRVADLGDFYKLKQLFCSTVLEDHKCFYQNFTGVFCAKLELEQAIKIAACHSSMSTLISSVLLISGAFLMQTVLGNI